MTAPRYFHRDRRNQALRVSFAVLLSIVAHLILILGVSGMHTNSVPEPSLRPIEARLVSSKKLEPDVPAAAYPIPQRAPEPVESSEPLPKEPEVVSTPSPTPAESSPIAAVPSTVDQTFYTWREVDTPAKCKSDRSEPPYPKAAEDANIRGRVIIELWVDEIGKVDDATVIEADPPGYFEEVSLAFHKAMRCTPAMKEGKPKRYRTRFAVEFGRPLIVLEEASLPR
ncbi:MAG TPA: TonB family protein [Burkholderiales bacterium]|nr:TonB family protein [Burkholderiales bacterium]